MRDRLRSIIATELEVPPDSIGPDASADTVAAWDSLGHLRIITAIEDQLGVRFSTAEIPELTSLDKLVAALQDRA